jgi:hypothetical protein
MHQNALLPRNRFSAALLIKLLGYPVLREKLTRLLDIIPPLVEKLIKQYQTTAPTANDWQAWLSDFEVNLPEDEREILELVTSSGMAGFVEWVRSTVFGLNKVNIVAQQALLEECDFQLGLIPNRQRVYDVQEIIEALQAGGKPNHIARQFMTTIRFAVFELWVMYLEMESNV